MPVIALLLLIPFLVMFIGATLGLLMNEASAGFLFFLIFLLLWAVGVRIYNEHRKVVRMNAIRATAELRRIKRHQGFEFYLDKTISTFRK